MFSLAFHAFLRIGEITVQTVAYANPHLLMLHQIQIQPQHLTGHFTSFIHSNGQDFSLKVKPSTPSEHCPVRIMRQYLCLRGSQPGPLFQHSPQSPITKTDFTKELKKALHFCRIAPSGIKSHCFRIGAATTAAAMGFSNSHICQLGHWK